MSKTEQQSMGVLEAIAEKIDILAFEIGNLREELVKLRDKVTVNQVWYDLKQSCSIKGINYNTVVSRSVLQPNNGKPDAIIAGRRRWRKETIMAWVEITDFRTEGGNNEQGNLSDSCENCKER